MNDTFEKDVASAIWDWEWHNNGWGNCCGVDLDVQLVRINEKLKKASAVIVANHYDDPDHLYTERFTNCEYSFKALGL